MTFRFQIQSNPESVQDIELAAESRFWDGLELLAAGRSAAGVYLLGYTVEMLLKSACFRIDGTRPYDLIGPRLGPVRHWASKHLPGVSHEAYHSLWFWAHVLRRKRHHAGRPFDRLFDSRLIQRVRRVYGVWIVAMRYQPIDPLPIETRTVYDDVTWVRYHRPHLVN